MFLAAVMRVSRKLFCVLVDGVNVSLSRMGWCASSLFASSLYAWMTAMGVWSGMVTSVGVWMAFILFMASWSSGFISVRPDVSEIISGLKSPNLFILWASAFHFSCDVKTRTVLAPPSLWLLISIGCDLRLLYENGL